MKAEKEAQYYTAIAMGQDNVQCHLCPHNCIIIPGKTGICGVRRNAGGKLYSEIYGRVSAIAMDPIEKKPLYHFYPSSRIFSIGTVGCNLKCPYCQNWNISQDASTETAYYDGERIVSMALENNSVGIAYTYSEPGNMDRVCKGCEWKGPCGRPEECSGDKRLHKPGAVEGPPLCNRCNEY